MSKKLSRKPSTKDAEMVDLTPLAKPAKKVVTKAEIKEKVEKMNKLADKKAKSKSKPKSKFNLADDLQSEMDGFEIMILNSDNAEDVPCYIIPFKNKSLQFITGGIMGGKFHEISGDSQTGKSYLLFELYSAVQKMGGVCLHQDGERAFTSQIANACDIALDGTFGITHERDINKLFSRMLKFIQAVRKKDKTCPILIGIDSFPGLQTKAALATFEAGTEPKGYAAMQKNGAFSQAIEKFIPELDNYDATLILINQTRKLKGVIFGDPIVTLGEDVIKFWCTQRIRGRHSTKLKSKVNSSEKKDQIEIKVGMVVEWEAIKNRLVAPFQKAKIQTLFSKGILPYSGIAELLTNHGRILYYNPKKKKKDDKPAKETKEEKEAKSKKPTYTHIESGIVYDSIVDLIAEHPEVLNPIKVGDLDDNEIEEDNEPTSIETEE